MSTRALATTLLARAAARPAHAVPTPRRSAPLLRAPLLAPLLSAVGVRRGVAAKASMVREGERGREGKGAKAAVLADWPNTPTRAKKKNNALARARCSLPPRQEDLVREKNAANPVVVYSKTYCPYCREVKSLLHSLGVTPKVIELDDLPDVAAGVAAVTGRTTVPQVFVGGVHVGGCDDTVAANASGELARLLAAAGVVGASA